MQRIITITAFSCLGLLSLQGRAVPHAPNTIKTNEQLINIAENTVKDMLQPHHETPEAKALIAIVQQAVYNRYGSWFGNVHVNYDEVQKTVCTTTVQQLSNMARAYAATKRVLSLEGQQTVATEIKDDINYQLDNASYLSGVLKDYAPGRNLEQRARQIIIQHL